MTHTKQCIKCKKTLDISNFAKRDDGASDGYRNECHECKKHISKTIRELKKTHIKADCCDICGSSDKLVLDHCHVTDKFRGWLCNECNTGLGKLGDSLDRAKRAVEYLEGKIVHKHKKQLDMFKED